MYQNGIFVCISRHRKIGYFRPKNADIGRTQGVCHVIHIFFESLLGKV